MSQSNTVLLESFKKLKNFDEEQCIRCLVALLNIDDHEDREIAIDLVVLMNQPTPEKLVN